MIIGVITYWDSSDNYGQILQCYALQKYLRGKGHDVFLIKYSPDTSNGLTVKAFLKFLNPTFVIRKIFTYKKNKRFYYNEQILRSENALKNQIRKFEEFRDQYIVSTKKNYKSIVELKENPPKADVYICGSDQVWRDPIEDSNVAGWYLQFGGKNIIRASYAASMGRNLKNDEKRTFSKYLSQFDYISLREEKTRELCVSLGYKNAITVVDPTLLLNKENYLQLCSDMHSFSNPYLFCYVLNVETEQDFAGNGIKEIAKDLGLQMRMVVSSGYVQARDLVKGITNEMATIPEWIKLIYDSEITVTTSFHGVAFCIILRKDFYYIPLKNKYSEGNDRVINLLQKLNLSDRILAETSMLSDYKKRRIKWGKVSEKLELIKKESIDFIDKLLDNYE